jgi:hypothetical protein
VFNKSVTNYIRATTSKFLTTPCTLQAEVTDFGDYGQNITGWENVAVTKCRLLPAADGDSEKVIEFAGQEGIDELKRIILPYATPLDVGQRALIGGKVFYVASLDVGNTDEAFRSALIIRKAGADG